MLYFCIHLLTNFQPIMCLLSAHFQLYKTNVQALSCVYTFDWDSTNRLTYIASWSTGESKRYVLNMCYILDSLAEKYKLPWSWLVLITGTLSHVVGIGLNYGILGSLTIAQSQRFDVSTNESSWTGSVHMAICLSMCKYCHCFLFCIKILAVCLSVQYVKKVLVYVGET